MEVQGVIWRTRQNHLGVAKKREEQYSTVTLPVVIKSSAQAQYALLIRLLAMVYPVTLTNCMPALKYGPRCKRAIFDPFLSSEPDDGLKLCLSQRIDPTKHNQLKYRKNFKSYPPLLLI